MSSSSNQGSQIEVRGQGNLGLAVETDRLVPQSRDAPWNQRLAISWLRQPERSLIPVGAQNFHLGVERLQTPDDAIIFFRDPGARSIDRALADQTLKFFINAQAQHLFTSTGKVSLAEIEQDNVEQGLEFERGP